ncbi:MAG: PQQ-binding-like beta-propeller repeat protein [Acidobacteriota bacterium]|nr:PQQ-binding-like beta-propeller repeat protein [Acidobacteriota bacterium]
MSALRMLLPSLCVCLAVTATAGDWTHWRGPDQNGYSTQKNLPSSWSKDGENLLWHANVGTRATPMIMGDRVFMIGRVGSGETLQERVICLSLKDGKTIWEHRFNVFLTDIVEHRLGWAHIAGDAATGYIYAHGVQGLLWCFDKDGKVIWSRSLTESLGRISGYGGRTHSPIVVNDMVIMGSSISSWGKFGRALHRVAAMDKMTGEIRWWYTAPGRMLDTTYSVPVIADLNGQLAMIAGFADGSVRALQVNTGKMIWSYQLSKRGINTSVLYHDGKVYATHSEENLDTNVMGAIVCLDATKTGDLSKTGVIWRRDGLGLGSVTPTMADGMLFAASNKANLYCLDPNTGEKKWEFNYGTAAKGSPLIADGKIYIGEVAGKYHILSYDKNGAKRLSEETFLTENGSPIEIYSSPSVGDGRVLLATKDDVYCIGSNPTAITEAKPKVWKTPKGGKAAQLQVLPNETWIDTGESQNYRAVAFDARGNRVGEVKPKWSVTGIDGSFSGSKLTTKASKNAQAGEVKATFDGMEGTARLRVFPPLPYEEDFEDIPEGKSPPAWITSPVKSKIVEKDGNKVLMKLADRMHPAFARMRNYMMPPLKPGYTVQADIYGQSKKRRFWPDMGLINSRYMLRVMGTTKKPVVRLVSWDPMPRIQKDVPFDWKTDAWYTAKLSYDFVDGKGMVRAKVWPRGEAEPKDWTIEMVDPSPNTGGSPGLYGYSVAISEKSPGTPVYYDNVKITRNK